MTAKLNDKDFNMPVRSVIIEAKEDQERFKKWIGLDKINGRTVGEIYFDKFQGFKQRLKSPYNDLYWWMKTSTPEKFKEYIDDLEIEVANKENVKQREKDGARLVYSDDQWKVYEITTYEASAKYGKGTKWCISGSKEWADGGSGDGYFDGYYNQNGIRFYFFIKNGTEKYALAVYPDNTHCEIYNAEDVKLAYIPDAPKIPEIKVTYDDHSDSNILVNAIMSDQIDENILLSLMEQVVEDNTGEYCTITNNPRAAASFVEEWIPDGYLEYQAVQNGEMTDDEFNAITDLGYYKEKGDFDDSWDGDWPAVDLDNIGSFNTKKEYCDPKVYEKHKYWFFQDTGVGFGYEAIWADDWVNLYMVGNSACGFSNWPDEDVEQFYIDSGDVHGGSRADMLGISMANQLIYEIKEGRISKDVLNGLGLSDKFMKYNRFNEELDESREEFFKNSKVRDAQGNLLPVYHCSFSDFDTFSIDQEDGTLDRSDWSGEFGFAWFTDDINYARNYGDGSFEYECYLNITNPLDIGELNGEVEVDDGIEVKDDFYNEGVIKVSHEFIRLCKLVNIEPELMVKYYHKWYETGCIYDLTRRAFFKNLVVKLGYDGVEATEGGNRTWGCVRPNQLKLVSNENPTDKDSMKEDLKNGKVIGYRYEMDENHSTDLRAVVEFETLELGNTDILETVKQNFSMTDDELRKVKLALKDWEDAEDEMKQEAIDACLDAIGRKYPEAKYCLWLCNSKENVYNNYIEPFEGGQEPMDSYDYDEYEIEYDTPISNLGDEGYLYVFSKNPRPMNEELSREQEEFFKDSVIRNKDGLIPMWHGTDVEFSEFHNAINWFSTSKEYAKQYAEWLGNTPVYYEAYLNCKHPFKCGDTSARVFDTLPNKLSRESLSICRRLGIDEYDFRRLLKHTSAANSAEEYKLKLHTVTRLSEFAELVKAKGFDSIITLEDGHPCVGVFNPEDIKRVSNLKPTISKNIDEEIVPYRDTGLEPNFTQEDIKAYAEQDPKHLTFGLSEGASVVLSDGTTINVTAFDTHSLFAGCVYSWTADLSELGADENGEPNEPDWDGDSDEDAVDHMYGIGVVTLNDGTSWLEERRKVVFEGRPTERQLEVIRDFIDMIQMKSKSDDELYIFSGHDFQTYRLGEYTSDEIIDKIKKSFVTGRLEEEDDEYNSEDDEDNWGEWEYDPDDVVEVDGMYQVNLNKIDADDIESFYSSYLTTECDGMNGPVYIFPDGLFMDIMNDFGDRDSIHYDIAFDVIENFYNVSSDVAENSVGAVLDCLESTFGLIRCNGGDGNSENRTYIAIGKQPTADQYEALEKYFYNLWQTLGKQNVSVNIEVSGFKSATFEFDKVQPEGIVKAIKRYFVSGQLLNEKNYKTPTKTYKFDGDTVSWDDDAEDYIYWSSEADKWAEDYAKFYKVKMSPKDFLDLTTEKGADALKKGDRIGFGELRDLDVDEFNKWTNEPIYLNIAFRDKNNLSTAQVIGHEGRHRMFGLMQAGYKSVDVELNCEVWDTEYDKYHPYKLDKLTLIGQFNKNVRVTVYNPVALSWKQHKAIRPNLKDEDLKEFLDLVDITDTSDKPVYATDSPYSLKNLLMKGDKAYRIYEDDGTYYFQDASGNKTHFDMLWTALHNGWLANSKLRQDWDDDDLTSGSIYPEDYPEGYMVFIPFEFSTKLRYHTKLGEDDYWDCRVYPFGVMFVRTPEAYDNSLFSALGEPEREIHVDDYENKVTVNKDNRTIDIDVDTFDEDPNTLISRDLTNIDQEMSDKKQKKEEIRKLRKQYLPDRFMDYDYGSLAWIAEKGVGNLPDEERKGIIRFLKAVGYEGAENLQESKKPTKNQKKTKLTESIKKVANEDEVYYTNSPKELLDLLKKLGYTRFVYFPKEDLYVISDNYIHDDLGKIGRSELGCNTNEYAFIFSDGASMEDDISEDEGDIYSYDGFQIFDRDGLMTHTSLYKYLGEPKEVKHVRDFWWDKKEAIKEDLQEIDNKGNVLSKEQVEFFKNSKVRKNGKLLVVYHGTTESFDTFDLGDIGFHFGTEEAAKEVGEFKSGQRDKGFNVGKYYLNITKPLVVKDDIFIWSPEMIAFYLIYNDSWGFDFIKKIKFDIEELKRLFPESVVTKEQEQQYRKKLGGSCEWYDILDEHQWYLSELSSHRREDEKVKYMVDLFKKSGYDGIKYRNDYEDAGSNSWIAFEPNQIKSITNKEPTSSKNVNENELTEKIHNILPDEEGENYGGWWTDSVYELKKFIDNSVVRGGYSTIKIVYFPREGIWTFGDAWDVIHTDLIDSAISTGLVNKRSEEERYLLYTSGNDEEEIDYRNVDIKIYDYGAFDIADLGWPFDNTPLYQALGKPKSVREVNFKNPWDEGLKEGLTESIDSSDIEYIEKYHEIQKGPKGVENAYSGYILPNGDWFDLNGTYHNDWDMNMQTALKKPNLLYRGCISFDFVNASCVVIPYDKCTSEQLQTLEAMLDNKFYKQEYFELSFASKGGTVKKNNIFDFNPQEENVDDVMKYVKLKNGNINESKKSDDFDSIVEIELSTLNAWLDKYGFEAELITDENELENIDWSSQYGEDAIGMFLADIQDNASVFPIALNKKAIKEICKDRDDLIRGIKTTLWHEAGHGIYNFLADMYEMPENVEDCVEEFARYRESSELFDVLQNYATVEESCNTLTESKQDQQNFIDKFGEQRWMLFNQLKTKLSNKDIYYWLKKSEEELDAELERASKVKSNKEKRGEDKSGAILRAEDENWKAYKITSYGAAKYYGYGTQWCISSADGAVDVFTIYGPTKEAAIQSLYDSQEVEGIEGVYNAGNGYWDIEAELPSNHYFDAYHDNENIYFFISKPENEECFESDRWCKVAYVRPYFYDAEDMDYGSVNDLPDNLQAFLKANTGTIFESLNETLVESELSVDDFSVDNFEDWCWDGNMRHEINNVNCSSYFIFKDGEIFGTPSTHEDAILTFFEDNDVIIDENNTSDAYHFLQELVTKGGVIRCTGEDFEHYAQLPPNGLTERQYDALTDWLDYYSTRLKGLEISCDIPSAEMWNFNQQHYDYKDNTVDEIIKKIRRFYSTGKLVESKQDIEKFKQWAGEELANRFFAVKDRLQGNQKDIYYWMGLEKQWGKQGALQELSSTLRELENIPSKKERQELAKGGSTKVYEDNDWLVLRIDTYEAAVKYGKGTQWCITGNNSYDGRTDFDMQSEGVYDFYFFIPKNPKAPREKYCLKLSKWNNDDWVLYNEEDYVEVYGDGLTDTDSLYNNDTWHPQDTGGKHRKFPTIPNFPDINKAYAAQAQADDWEGEVIAEEYEQDVYYRGYDSRYGVFDSNDPYAQLYTWITDEIDYAAEYAVDNPYGKIAKVRLTCSNEVIGGPLDLQDGVDYIDPGDDAFKRDILDEGMKGYGFLAGDYDDYCVCISKDCVEVIDPDVKYEPEEESLKEAKKEYPDWDSMEEVTNTLWKQPNTKLKDVLDIWYGYEGNLKWYELYHGTTEKNWKKILKDKVIKPGQKKNYGASKDGCVYLTTSEDDAYEYVFRGTDGNENAVVMSINLSKLDLDKLYIDTNESYAVMKDEKTGKEYWDFFDFEYYGEIPSSAWIKTDIDESLKEEAEKENILDALDKEFGQEDVYMWSTYVLPNGHFLNPDNSKSFEDRDPDYEHCDFEDWAWAHGYHNEEIFNNCLKMNVTWPYISMPDKARPTQEQLKAVKKIIEHKDMFIQDGLWYDVFPEEKIKDKGPNLLAIYTPVGDELFDLDVSDADDIVRAINQAYVRGSFLGEELNESKEDWEKFRKWCNDDSLYNWFLALRKRLANLEVGYYKKADDIYWWMKHRTPIDLFNYLDEVQHSPTKKERERSAKEGAKLLYDANGWKVYEITTYEASVKYGKGTTWCISGENGYEGYDYFSDYAGSGDKIYFYIKGDDKWAVIVDGSYWTIFDALDNKVASIPGAPQVEGLPDVSKFKDEVVRAVVQLYKVNPSDIENIVNALDDSELSEFFFDYDTREAYCIELKDNTTRFMYWDSSVANFVDVTDEFKAWVEEYM